MRGFISDETPDKLYDGRLVARMSRYAKPFIWQMVGAFFLVVIMSGIELLNPYIQKLMIDDYIVFNERFINIQRMSESQRSTFMADYLDKAYKISDALYIADPKNFVKTDSRIWEKDSIISQNKVFVTDTSTNSEKAAIVVRYEGVFKPIDATGKVYADLDDLVDVEGQDIKILRKEDLTGVYKLGTLFILLVLVGAVISFLQIYTLAWIGQQIMKAIRIDLFSHMQRLSLSFFDRNPIGRLVTRATNDVNAINEMFTSVAVNLFNDILMFFGIIVLMYFLSPTLLYVLLATMPIIIISTIFFRSSLRRAYRVVRRKLAEINSTLSEHFAGVRTIKHFAREMENIRRFKVLDQQYYKANMKQLFVMSVFRPVTAVVENLGIALLIWYGGRLVLSTTLPLGTLVAFISYARMFFRPIIAFAEKINIMQAAMAASERIVGILDTEPDIQNIKNPVVRETTEGEIEFRNVWFSYSGTRTEWVLRDLSFKVSPGESVALVGETGAGKTTITSLLPRFYDIQKGSIFVDGVDIREWDKESLRQKIGIVLQDVFIFATSVAGNIRLNNMDISDENVKKAARIVNADSFISNLPNGYDEIMNERGATLSTGQKQLLAFARVLAFDPRILILDEATASIDTETEKLIQDALLKLLKKRTSIVVAHRLSTIKHADRILVIHKGKIVEEGDHQTLLSKRGVYHNLYLLQYADQEDDISQ